MDQGFMKTAIMKSKKLKGAEKFQSAPLKGIEKAKLGGEMGSISSKEMESFKGAEKMKSSLAPKATKSEDMIKLDRKVHSFIKSNKVKSKEMDSEESEEGYSLSPKTEDLSKESPKVKKAYEEWLKKKKHLEMMGE
jgi:hypothetical protein